MYFRLMGKLNARRNGTLAEDEKGFTLIELLVVVIIIGILAAIAIPVYLGVQKNAKDSAVKTDVTNLKTAVVSEETELGGLPDAFSTVGTSPTYTPDGGTAVTSTQTWSDAGATKSQDTTTLTYTPGTDGAFCILAKGSTNDYFYATNTDGVQAGDSTSCTAAG